MSTKTIRVLIVLLVALTLAAPVFGSRKGRWGFGDNRYFIVDQVCRDGMQVSAVDSSYSSPPTFTTASTPISLGARLYTTSVPLPVYNNELSRLPAADYGPQLAPLTVLTMTAGSDPLPADFGNDGEFDEGFDYFDVYFDGEFITWDERLTPGQVVVVTHNSFNDGNAELGYESLAVDDCYIQRFTAPKAAARLLGNSLLTAGGALPGTQVVYRVLRLPGHGSLRLNGVALTVGGTFTQDDVNNGRVSYLHNGDSAAVDDFRVDVAGLAWVSVTPGGVRGNNDSAYPTVSADGRRVAFWSLASDLVASDGNNRGDIFVRDVLSGTTGLASGGLSGAGGNGDVGIFPAISGNGRYVAFRSAASNLVAGDTNTCPGYATAGACPDIFVRDLQTGVTVRVSVATDGTQANQPSDSPAISYDGRYVVYETTASTLITGDTNGLTDIYLRDRDTDADGVFDEAGAVSTARVSISDTEQQGLNGGSGSPAISADGRQVAFFSIANNLVTGDTNTCPAYGYTTAGTCPDIFVRDVQAGTTTLISRATGAGGALGDGPAGQAALSADGRYVAFTSYATNLVLTDFNQNCGGSGTDNCGDVFVRDRQTNTTRRVSLSAGGGEVGFGYIDGPAISADGSRVWFTTSSGGVVFPDNNSAYDVFVHDWVAGGTLRASTTVTEGEGNAFSYYADLSADGQYVVFDSFAQLAPGDPVSTQDVYVRYMGFSQTVSFLIQYQNALPVIRR